MTGYRRHDSEYDPGTQVSPEKEWTHSNGEDRYENSRSARGGPDPTETRIDDA